MAEYLLSVWMIEGQEPPSEDLMQQLYRDVDVFNEKLKAEGAWVWAGGLEPPTDATVVRIHDGKPVETAGLFATSKEQLGGFWVIEAPDREAALAWAREATAACQSPVEVRPFQAEPSE